MKIIRVFLGLFAVCCLLAGCASSSPAVSAIMKHDVNGLKKILDSGVSPNFVEDHEGGYGHGESLLAISFNSGYDNDASRLLLDRGADLAKSKALYTSIIAANSLYGETPDIKSPISLLLEKGVNPNQKLDNGISIIHAACSDPKNMRVLISNGANTNDLWIAPTNEYSQTPLSACLLAADKVEREIIEFRNTLSSPYYSSDPSIMRSAIDRNTRLLNRNIDSVLILLDSGANPNTTLLAGVGGKTAPVLNFAISSENLRVVRAMLDHGADPMAVSEPRKRSALHIAAEFGYEEIAKLLINSALASAKKDKNGNQKFRSWLNGRFNNEMTALHFAAKSGSADLFQILINAGADASVKDNNGYTAQIYLDQKLEADRASKLAAQSVVDAKRRERDRKSVV